VADQKFEYSAQGKKHSCSFNVTRGKQSVVKVTTPWGRKSTHKGGLPTSVIAKFMAGELYRKHIERRIDRDPVLNPPAFSARRDAVQPPISSL
jgi:hypothetical protein